MCNQRLELAPVPTVNFASLADFKRRINNAKFILVCTV